MKHLPFVLSLAALAFACTKSGGGKSAPLSLIYPTTAPTYDACGAITSNVPTYSGGAPTSWSISPALPSGLTLDPATGVISGTPDALSAPTIYTVTGTNS
ncbi:MAG: putative Ig domain-containing protein, partial [Planctomycetota bacterium]|nr:putative Ig domain-containing protein [Planctomycetota bacterium]